MECIKIQMEMIPESNHPIQLVPMQFDFKAQWWREREKAIKIQKSPQHAKVPSFKRNLSLDRDSYLKSGEKREREYNLSGGDTIL
jgi:hypothetical protein